MRNIEKNFLILTGDTLIANSVEDYKEFYQSILNAT